MIIKELASGRLQADGDVLRSLNTCTTCGLCTESCPAGVSPPDIIERGKRSLVSQGKMTQVQDALSRSIFQSGNTFGSGDDRLAWLRDRSLVKERADYVYFVGCMISYRYQETAKNTYCILSRFGATVLA